MIRLTKKQIDTALLKLEKPAEAYTWIQSQFKNRNVLKDREFQKKFNGFYRVRRNKNWQKSFYTLFENNKNNLDMFEKILVNFYEKTNRAEASFVSKMIATIDPRMPIIDSIVFKNLGLRLPSANTKNRTSIINDRYQTLIKEYSMFLKTDMGRYLIKKFIEKYPKTKITTTKMLDFVLWQSRNK